LIQCIDYAMHPTSKDLIACNGHVIIGCMASQYQVVKTIGVKGDFWQHNNSCIWLLPY